MKASGSRTRSKPQKRSIDKKRGHQVTDKTGADNDSEYDAAISTDDSVHYASLELKKILNMNEGIEKMNEFAAQLHQEFVDASDMRPGAASAFYDQLVSIENAPKYPTYLSHTPDSMFETKHIKFESPILNPGCAGLVCRDPSPEEYAKFLANSDEREYGAGPSVSYIDRHLSTPPTPSTTAPKIRKSGKSSRMEKSATALNDTEDEIQSVINAPEIWKLLPDNSYAARQNLKDSMISDGGERQNKVTRRIVNNYYPTKDAFMDSTKSQTFWVHLGIPMPSPPSPFLTSTFLKLNNPHPQPSGLVTLDNGVRRFCVAMNGFSSEELTFTVEGKRVAVTGTKPKDKKNPQGLKRTATEGFILPDDLNLHDLQVHRDDVGNVIFEEIWHEPRGRDAEKRLTVLNEDIPDFLLKE